jgi:hypothetical protein
VSRTYTVEFVSGLWADEGKWGDLQVWGSGEWPWGDGGC